MKRVVLQNGKLARDALFVRTPQMESGRAVTAPFQQRTLLSIVKQRRYSTPDRGTDNMARLWLRFGFPALDCWRSLQVVKLTLH